MSIFKRGFPRQKGTDLSEPRGEVLTFSIRRLAPLLSAAVTVALFTAALPAGATTLGDSGSTDPAQSNVAISALLGRGDPGPIEEGPIDPIPSVRIYGIRYPRGNVGPGEYAALSARVSFPSPGPYDEHQVHWRSNRDGFLGYGTSISTRLSQPEPLCYPEIIRHRITVTAHDASGRSTSRSFNVYSGLVY